ASVARRHQQLAAEIARLDAAPGELLTRAAPKQLLAKQGVATQVAATLLATARRQPQPGPHRGQLRRAVRRQPGRCLLRQAAAPPAQPRRRPARQLRAADDRHDRLAHDPRTKAYPARRTTEGKPTNEIIRCLKRYLAREISKTLCQPKPPATASAPQAKQDLPAPVLT